MEWIWIQVHGVGWNWGWKSGPWRPLPESMHTAREVWIPGTRLVGRYANWPIPLGSMHTARLFFIQWFGTRFIYIGIDTTRFYIRIPSSIAPVYPLSPHSSSIHTRSDKFNATNQSILDLAYIVHVGLGRRFLTWTCPNQTWPRQISQCQNVRHGLVKVRKPIWTRPSTYAIVLRLGRSRNGLDCMVLVQVRKLVHVGHGLVHVRNRTSTYLD